MNPGRFQGKRVLITGSTRGIGRAAAERFLDEGASVLVHGSGSVAVKAVVAELQAQYTGRVSGHAADLSDRGQCLRLGEQAEGIDVLINCAGIFEERMMGATDEAFWDHMLEINTTAPWVLSRQLSAELAKRMGVIVNVSSDAGLLGYPGCAAYCASKGALIGLTRALAVELAPDVRVLCVCPGPVDTDMMRQAVMSSDDPEAVQHGWESLPLLRRVARPHEIASAIAFAASVDNSFATGSLLVVDGGVTAGRRVTMESGR
jgi:NAD(P)-dependent dehydrogenase (short-subunit alcohol dehydrogenase family)